MTDLASALDCDVELLISHTHVMVPVFRREFFREVFEAFCPLLFLLLSLNGW